MPPFVNNPTIKNTNIFANGNTNRNPEKKPTVNTIRTFLKGTLAKQVKTEDLSPDDVIIVVMGPTGSGKSSFINTITGLETSVGHDLESCTSNVRNVRLSIPEMAFGDLVFVDAPGLDDTHQEDADILKMVADWLQSTYEKKMLLSGLLYFHRISDNRMAGTPLKNLRMFEELCGKNAFQNVILTTTMWDEVDEETGENRERELKTEYWRSMLERGSTTSRFLRTRESAFDIIEPLLEAANKRSSVLLQSELVDMRRSRPATAAGLELFSTMGQLVSQREDLLRRIRHEMRRLDDDKIALEPLQEEHQKLRNNLEAVVSEIQKLRLPLGKRLLSMTHKFFSKKFEYLKSLIPKRLGNTDVSVNGNTNRNLGKKPIVDTIFTFFKGALANLKHVKMEDLTPNDIIIAVVGPIGSGKSSLINTITGLETDHGVGHGLESYTSDICIVRLSIPEMAFGDLVFVDTPGLGFEYNHQEDVDILKMVVDWLQSACEKKILLSGLLYFHRISDNRMAGTPLKNLREFEKLCGKNAFQNIILTTTMWDEVDEKTGENRERELKTEYWRTMLERGSTTSRFLRTRESAFDVIEPFLEAANKKSSVLLQSELADMRKSFPATAAGQELFSTMGQLVIQLEDLLRRIRQEMRRSDGDKLALEVLQEELQKLQNGLQAVVSEMQKLRLPLKQRLLSMTDKFFSSKFEYLKSLISNLKRLGESVADHLSTGAIQDPKEQSQDDTAPNQNSPTGIQLVGDPFGHQPADHPPTDAIPNDSIDCPNQSSPSSTSHTPIANGSNDLSQGMTNQQVQDSLESDQTLPTRTGTISRNPIDRSNQSSPISTSHTPSPRPITNILSQLERQGTASDTVHSGTTKQQAQDNTVSDQIPRTGAFSKDPIDCPNQSSPSSTSHTLSPRPIANGSNDLPQGQGTTSGTIHSGTTKQRAQDNTLSDQTPPTCTQPVGNPLRRQPADHPPYSPLASLKGDLSPEDVIIAVMGPTGSGKSTFIKTVVENSNIAVGHGLKSCTSDISTVRFSFPELSASDIVFVDTPGFDHTNKTETDVLEMVADWLKTIYEQDILLSGLVYCHPISNTGMDATSVRHLRTFVELCGKDALQNVILATTMWDEVDEATGEKEEERMKTKYWNKMLERKSTTGRFMGTYESALQLLQPLIDAANLKRSSLLLQHEMVDMGKQLSETSAGRHLFSKARYIVSRH